MKENREKPKIKSRGKKKKKRRRNEDKKKDDGGEEEKRQKTRWITSAATKRERERECYDAGLYNIPIKYRSSIHFTTR